MSSAVWDVDMTLRNENELQVKIDSQLKIPKCKANNETMVVVGRLCKNCH